MPALDPTQLLKALNPLLGPTGAILGPTEATRIASLMKDASKMVSKCVYLNILKLETPSEAIEKFLGIGGWDTLNDWLQGFKDGENNPLLTEILKVYKAIPVTVEILKKNNAAKTIKQLCKSENENVKTLASNIFEEWMKKVKNNNNATSNMGSSEPSLKKKKKDKEKKDNEKGEENETDTKSDKSKNSKDSKSLHHRHLSGDHQTHSSSHHSHSSSHSKDRKTDRKSTDSSESVSQPSVPSSEDIVSVRKGSGLKLHIKLGSEKEKKDVSEKSDKSDSDKKRPSTVKRPPSKFRMTGLEEEIVPGKSIKSLEKQPVPKRTSTDTKSEPPIKKSRLHMPPPLSVPSPVSMTTTVTTPSSSSPTSPSEIHGKIKLIPARPRANHLIHDSSGFMDSITKPLTYGAFKKKRKAMAATAAGNGPLTPTGTNGKVPSTPPSPLSPTTAVARMLPAVPSFYKDTQAETETEPSPEKDQKEEKERSPSPMEEADITESMTVKDDSKDDTTPVQMEIDDDDYENADYDPEDKERSLSPDSLSGNSKETKGLLTTGATKKKKKKKSVRWREEHELKEIFYFALDEDERVNVNREKDFKQAKKNEMIYDRRVMESARRLVNDNMMEQIAWYRPRLMAGIKEIDYGKESTEKTIQKVREQGVLQALYFNRSMLPDGPQEPDIMHEEAVETKIMPLEDVSGGDEFCYNYDAHPEAVKNPPTESWRQIQQQQQQQQQPPQAPPMPPQPPIPPPPPMMNLPPGMNLPPELIGLIAQIQNMPPDQSGPVMSQVQQMLNNIMGGSSDQSYDQLQQLHQMMNSQMAMPIDGMVPGPPPLLGPPPMGMPPQGPPMGPRQGLLGNAPPGFMPQRPMGPPNRFGGPGPGSQGNWGDGPPMGPNQGGQGNHGGHGGRQNNNWPQRRNRGGSSHRGSRGRQGGSSGMSRTLCRHFASGSCKMGSECGFLHPGMNGPPLKKEQSVDS